MSEAIPFWRRMRVDGAPAQLITLHGFKQRLEVALAEALIVLALNKLKENWPDQGL